MFCNQRRLQLRPRYSSLRNRPKAPTAEHSPLHTPRMSQNHSVSFPASRRRHVISVAYLSLAMCLRFAPLEDGKKQSGTDAACKCIAFQRFFDRGRPFCSFLLIACLWSENLWVASEPDNIETASACVPNSTGVPGLPFCNAFRNRQGNSSRKQVSKTI